MQKRAHHLAGLLLIASSTGWDLSTVSYPVAVPLRGKSLSFLNPNPNDANNTPGHHPLGTQKAPIYYFTKREQRSLVKPSHRTQALNNPLVLAQKLPHFRQTEVVRSCFQEVLIWRRDPRDYRRRRTTGLRSLCAIYGGGRRAGRNKKRGWSRRRALGGKY